MSDLKQQIAHLCAFNRKLARDGSVLRLRVRNQEIEIAELKQVNADLTTRLRVADLWLNAAMDAALGGERA